MRGLWKSVLLLLATIAVTAGAAAQDHFANWPAGRSPEEVGKRLAEHFVTSPHKYGGGFYSEVAAWYGALSFARLTGDAELRDKLVKRFDPIMPGGPDEKQVARSLHVDEDIVGVVPLEIAMQTRDAKYLDYGKHFADLQWQNPLPDGLSAETRYWIDDMYMVTILQVQTFRATGDRTYLDRAALQMVAYLDKLQQPNGLFHHAPDVPVFWGRGDGWVAAGMTEILRDLPADHPRRARILKGYKTMMAALLKYQGKDGMWRQIIDRADAWPESSSTAMFTFAMITGVKNGWLDTKTYGPAARKGWIAVTGYIDQNGDVTSVCAGTGKKNDVQYYMERPRITGDYHGQAPVMWAASALLRPARAAGVPKIDGIAHVAFRVADLEAARAFWRRLGFEESFVFKNGEQVSQVFVKVNDRQFIELYPRNDPAQPLGWLHVCYESDAAEALQALYEQRGLAPSKVHKGGAGNFIFTFTGPAGELIEVTQYLPGSRHTLDRGSHLGAGRIADALRGIRMSVPDLPAAERFYAAGLGMKGQKGTFTAGGQRIELKPAGRAPEFIFGVSSTRATAARLKKLGIAASAHGARVRVNDPDGNTLVFEAPSRKKTTGAIRTP